MTTTRAEDARRLQCVVLVLENDSVFCEKYKRNGTASRRRQLRPNISNFCYWQGAFDYPITPGQAAAEAAQAAWEAQYNEVKAKAEAIYQGVLDELIMSPDGKAALERIAAAFA